MRKILKKILGDKYKYLKIFTIIPLIFNNLKIKHLNFFYKYPEVINLTATEYCNSQCVMCNIWKQDRFVTHLAVTDYEKLFKNKIFKKIKHVGVTGGEPTLRDDLPAIYDKIFQNLPKVKGASIIANCIDSENVISKIIEIRRISEKHHKSLNIMLSLDGLNKIHDVNRGIRNNYINVLRVISFLKNNNIDFVVGVTITKINVWHLNELLDFLKKHHIKANFRIAEFINRLYNSDLSAIRNFDKEEIYHLRTFFLKLIYEYEINDDIKRTYFSIINVLNGGNRIISCPYKTKGIVLNGFGQIATCAPKGDLSQKIISQDHLYSEWKRLRKERKSILNTYCDNCIHDYHSKITLSERITEIKNFIWYNILNLDRIKLIKLFKFPSKTNKNFVLITGWYGTETTGDKAILGGIIQKILFDKPDSEIAITSLHPLVTKKTINELAIKAKIINVYSLDFIRQVRKANIVIMGGGPIMDIETLFLPLWSFALAKKKAKKIIWGCGIGPLYDERYKKAVSKILLKSNQIMVRDNKSKQLASDLLSVKKEIEVIEDPAIDYLRSLAIKPKIQKNVLSCYLREWSIEYASDKTNYFDTRKKIEKNIAELIKRISKQSNLKIVFYPMHTYFVGGDDRDFYNRFINEYFRGYEIECFQKNSSVNTIIESMYSAKYNVCMRYHSVVFAETLGVDYLAIDYTNGGKISSFLNDKGKLENLVAFNDLINENTSH